MQPIQTRHKIVSNSKRVYVIRLQLIKLLKAPLCIQIGPPPHRKECKQAHHLLQKQDNTDLEAMLDSLA
jgi:hypothetical protein